MRTLLRPHLEEYGNFHKKNQQYYANPYQFAKIEFTKNTITWLR